MLTSYHPRDKENRNSLIWLFFITVLITWNTIYLPLAIAFNSKPGKVSLIFDIIVAISMGVDYWLRWKQKLNLPEYSGHKDSFEYEKRGQFKNSHWSVVDAISCLPFELIIFSLGVSSRDPYALFFFALQSLRLTKIRSVWGLSAYFPKYGKLAFLSFNITLAIHWIACGWIMLNPNVEVNPLEDYSLALYWAITTLTTVGYGDITPKTIFARFYTMSIMLIGVGVYGIIIGQISRLMMLSDRYTEDRKEKLGHLNQYMKHYQIPSSLQKEVFSFYGHILNKSMAKQDEDFLRELPTSLRNELEIYAKIKLIKNITFFKECSGPCLKLIAQKLQQACFNPQEMVIQENESGDLMYILAHGEVQVLVNGSIVKNLRPGQFFGEMALIENRKRTASVQAKTYCDLYTLCKEDFLEVIKTYPLLHDKFFKVYNERKHQNLKKAA